METITSADGAKISWQMTGSGRSLLLVHGTTADHTRWAGISPQFEQHFSVHAMDRRGRGASADDSQGYDIMREAEDVSAVVGAIGGPVDVLGHSYGAVCSLEAALLTGSVRKMVLYEPPLPTDIPMYPPGLPDRMQAMIDDGELEGALELFFREVVRMPDHELVEYRELPVWKQRIQLAPTIPRELAIDRSYSFEPEKFADLRLPTLLMLGGDSPPIFQRAVETADEAIPGSRVVLLPGQQHIAMDTNPALFGGEVLDFLLD